MLLVVISLEVMLLGEFVAAAQMQTGCGEDVTVEVVAAEVDEAGVVKGCSVLVEDPH